MAAERVRTIKTPFIVSCDGYMIVVDAGYLYNGIADGIIVDARMHIDGDRVKEVGRQADLGVPSGAQHLEFGDSVVIPGLIDAHLHLIGARTLDPMQWAIADLSLATARATSDCRDLVEAGFTTVRDVGSAIALGLRDAVAEGTIVGPRIRTSGRALSQTGGHGDTHFLPWEWVESGMGLVGSTLADGEAECRRVTRQRIRDGVDLIKIMTTGGVLSEKDSPQQTQYTASEIDVITTEAHRVGLPVASHAQGAPGINLALEYGVDTIEHGFYLNDRSIELFHETEAIFVPTLAISHRLATEGEAFGLPEYAQTKVEQAYEAHFESVRRAYEAEVPIAVGTDFLGSELLQHGDNAIEAELLVERVGMAEIDALRAATSVAADALGFDDVGSLASGKLADFVVLDANPLDDITALREIRAVFKGGERIP